MAIPQAKKRLRPWISASLPKGSRNMAAASRNEVATQLNETASMPNSSPMVGKAIFTEEPMKGIKKAARVAMARATF